MEDNTRVTETMVLDTIGGKLHRKFDHAGGTTMLGQLAFFIEFLQTNGLCERWIKSGTALFGMRRYRHINSCQS